MNLRDAYNGSNGKSYGVFQDEIRDALENGQKNGLNALDVLFIIKGLSTYDNGSFTKDEIMETASFIQEMIEEGNVIMDNEFGAVDVLQEVLMHMDRSGDVLKNHLSDQIKQMTASALRKTYGQPAP